jgi:hypothetical protein
MWFRRAILKATIPAAIVLPLWILVMQGIVAGPSAGTYLALVIVCPVLFVAMIVIAVLLRVRKSTRTSGALTWRDATVAVVFWLALVASGLFSFPALAVLDVVLLVGVFWLSAWELLDESRTRLKTFVDAMTVVPSQSSYIPPSRGETIIIEPHRS